jgi:hypothetical protein
MYGAVGAPKVWYAGLSAVTLRMGLILVSAVCGKPQ